jgi:hypothetical protein
MSLLPLPSRLPARKHLLAAGFGLLGLALMVGAVMNASGLTLPFTSGDPERVRAGSVLVDAPNPTTTAAPLASTPTTANPDRSRALAPAAVPGPTSTAPSVRPRPTPTTSTSTTLPSTSVPTLLPPLGLGGL